MPEKTSDEAVSNSSYEFVVPSEQAGERLDRFLVSQLPDFSRSQIQALIDEGRVHVDGVATKPAHHLEPGEEVFVEIPAPEAPGVEPEAISLDILYEDSDIAVINKPAGMIVHPGAGRTAARWWRRCCIGLAEPADYRRWEDRCVPA